MNKAALLDVLQAQEENRGTVMPTEAFALALESMGAPLTGQDMTKLMRIYDKKGEGRLDWDDLISEHKYINAVSELKKGCGHKKKWVWF